MNKDVKVSNMGCLGLAGPCRSLEILLEVSELTRDRMRLVTAAPALPRAMAEAGQGLPSPYHRGIKLEFHWVTACPGSGHFLFLSELPSAAKGIKESREPAG